MTDEEYWFAVHGGPHRLHIGPREPADVVDPVVVPRALLDRVAGLLERVQPAWGCPECAVDGFHYDCEVAEVRIALEKVCKGCAKPGDGLQPTKNTEEK